MTSALNEAKVKIIDGIIVGKAKCVTTTKKTPSNKKKLKASLANKKTPKTRRKRKQPEDQEDAPLYDYVKICMHKRMSCRQTR